MKVGYPLNPLRVPLIIGVVTAVALVSALVADGMVEAVSVGLLGCVVAITVLKILARQKRSAGA